MSARPVLRVLGALLVVIAAPLVSGSLHRDERIVVALLVPDDADLGDPVVTSWLDAGAEEGVPMEPVRASDFLRPTSGGARYVAVVLPDTVHTAMSEVLIDGVDAYVRQGGQLLVVFDAATLTLPARTYPLGPSRLSGLVGVSYAMYDELRGSTTRSSEILATARTLEGLRVPPGKFRPTAEMQGEEAPHLGAAPRPQGEVVISGYGYEAITYPHFVTRGAYDGRALFYTADGDVIAGERRHGRGTVLFVNLALGYLKTRTDGLFLHGFLHHLAVDLAGLPELSAAPDARGGVVMNWHVDSSLALPALRKLASASIFGGGPYSVHFTAGPDLTTFGDHLGLDVPGNSEARAWVRFFANRGDEVGSHGGWIHNYFGWNVTESNAGAFERFLRLNVRALEDASGRRVAEYSAPQGAHPEWVTRWLDDHGIHAYYFTGNTGMGPTRTYRDGRRRADRAWAFPVLTLGRDASFEEMAANKRPLAVVAAWLSDTSTFVAEQGVIRLIYFHPPGLLGFYPNVIDDWMRRSAELEREGTFAWYTMASVAAFLDARSRMEWRVVPGDRPEELLVEATHLASLAHQAWRVRADRHGRPEIVHGDAEVIRRGRDWIVRAGSGRRVVFKVPPPVGPAVERVTGGDR